MVEVQDAASLIIDTLQLIYDTPKLRSDIDDSFDADVKIPAIKHLKVWCENTNYPAWCEDVNLRICRDTIDIYYNRYNVKKKLNTLSARIEKWCKHNSWDNIGYKVDKPPYRYNHYEYVDDSIVNLENKLDWYPSKKTMKEFNTLWKRYNPNRKVYLNDLNTILDEWEGVTVVKPDEK